MKSLRHQPSSCPPWRHRLALAAPASAATTLRLEGSAPGGARLAPACCGTPTRAPARLRAALAKAAVCLINKQPRPPRPAHAAPERAGSPRPPGATPHDMVEAQLLQPHLQVGQRRGRPPHPAPATCAAPAAGPSARTSPGARALAARPREIVAAWMNSPGHRANILHRRFREIGIGVVVRRRRMHSSSSGARPTPPPSAPGASRHLHRIRGWGACPSLYRRRSRTARRTTRRALLVLGGAGHREDRPAASAASPGWWSRGAGALAARAGRRRRAPRPTCGRRSRSWSSRPTRSSTSTPSTPSASGCCATRRWRPGSTPDFAP